LSRRPQTMRTLTHQSAESGRTGTKVAQAQTVHPGDTTGRESRPRQQRMVRRVMLPSSSTNGTAATGSLDGEGSADHDQPYRFGFRPRASAPYPFNTRQYARLLVLRGRLQDHVESSLELTPVAVHQHGLRP